MKHSLGSLLFPFTTFISILSKKNNNDNDDDEDEYDEGNEDNVHLCKQSPWIDGVKLNSVKNSHKFIFNFRLWLE